MQSRVMNKPYDVFGTWYNDYYLLSGNLHWTGHLSACSAIWLNKVTSNYSNCGIIDFRGREFPGFLKKKKFSWALELMNFWFMYTGLCTQVVHVVISFVDFNIHGLAEAQNFTKFST